MVAVIPRAAGCWGPCELAMLQSVVVVAGAYLMHEGGRVQLGVTAFTECIEAAFSECRCLAFWKRDGMITCCWVY